MNIFLILSQYLSNTWQEKKETFYSFRKSKFIKSDRLNISKRLLRKKNSFLNSFFLEFHQQQKMNVCFCILHLTLINYINHNHYYERNEIMIIIWWWWSQSFRLLIQIQSLSVVKVYIIIFFQYHSKISVLIFVNVFQN